MICKKHKKNRRARAPKKRHTHEGLQTQPRRRQEKGHMRRRRQEAPNRSTTIAPTKSLSQPSGHLRRLKTVSRLARASKAARPLSPLCDNKQRVAQISNSKVLCFRQEFAEHYQQEMMHHAEAFVHKKMAHKNPTSWNCKDKL